MAVHINRIGHFLVGAAEGAVSIEIKPRELSESSVTFIDMWSIGATATRLLLERSLPGE
jgi:hypothetical protein